MVCEIIAEDISYVRKKSIVHARALKNEIIINVTMDLY